MRHFTYCAMLLSACTTIDHSPAPADWPQLKVIQHYVSSREMRNQCVQYAGPGSSPMACAEIDLHQGTCNLWFDKDFMAQWLLDHELLHCKGHDHLGGTTIQRMMEEYRAEKR